MAHAQREQRLAEELAVMRSLSEQSTLFEFQTNPDDPTPEEYTVTFYGRGINRTSSYQSDVEQIDEHQCTIKLKYNFPKRSPEIRWLTPIFHPNIPYSGFVKLRDTGLVWTEHLHLDVVCEHLWDLARCATLNLGRAANYTAKRWFNEQTAVSLPVDDRPLRDKDRPEPSNALHYEHEAQPHVAELVDEDSVSSIDRDTESVRKPQVRRPPKLPTRPPLPGKRDNEDDDGIHFIGED